MSASDGVISLADLMHRHQELLVKPLFWTSRHLELMGCRFQHVYNAPSREDTRDDQQPFQGKPNEGESEARSLARSFSLQGKLNALTNILLSKGSIFDKRSKGPYFTFAGHPVHRPHYTVFYRRDQPDRSVSQEPLPVIGYLNYTNVSGTRWHKFQPRHHDGGVDYAVSPLSKKKLARVTPKEWKEDPYFVCVLLSLAQLQEHRLKPSRPTSHSSRLLIASPMDREFIHLYEAQITSDFLRMLDNPAAATIQTNFPTIERRQIPFRPFETFQERIFAELLREQLGDGRGIQRKCTVHLASLKLMSQKTTVKTSQVR
ncbi:hypothetical protein N7460_006801 [Penicillium canescens]|uniref:Uncharacterized protein n=1 Tax=Penicillium canescens TaxID=5083 RepID=A0AAD6IBF7_PENCN|nr:hypothetical protein N7460_006801 [Penicillium canescens]